MTQSAAAQSTRPAARRLFDRLDEFERRPGRLWLVFFGYASVVAGFVQLVALPYIFPELHDGHGLLIEGDWVFHHRLISEIAMRIREEGWSAWQLRPYGEHGLQAIPSLLYAAIAPEPWTLIPLHAALHATSTLLLIHILRLFVSSWRVAVIAALSFLLSPSSLITYTQITKDAYSICGGFMFLYGWLLLARWPEGQDRKRAIGVAALIAGGAVVTWTGRPYLVQVQTSLSAGFAALIAIRMIVLGIRRVITPMRGVLTSAMAWVMVAMVIPLNALGGDMYLHVSPSPPEPVSPPASTVIASADPAGRSGEITVKSSEPAVNPGEPAVKLNAPAVKASEPSVKAGDVPRPVDAARPTGGAPPVAEAASPPGAAETLRALLAPPPRATRFIAPWTASPWVPSVIDNRLYSLARLRYRWRENVGRSTIDQDVMPASLPELAAYLPRLLVVGFLAPFPSQWFETGAFASTTIMRRAVGIEMVVTYIALVGLVLGAWRWRARLELWFLIAYGGIITLTWAFIVPNVGSLHRARFGFLMVLVALGIAGILSSPRIDRMVRVRR